MVADSFGEQFSDALLYLFVDLLLDDFLGIGVRVIEIAAVQSHEQFSISNYRDHLCVH